MRKLMEEERREVLGLPLGNETAVAMVGEETQEATSNKGPLLSTSPSEQKNEPLRPRFRFAPRLAPDELVQWSKGRERMRGQATEKEEAVQDETQGVDADVPSTQRDQHIESRACGAWDEHGPVG